MNLASSDDEHYLSPVDDDEHHYDDSDDGMLASSLASTHFSTTEDRFIKDHDLKIRAFEALQESKDKDKNSHSAQNAHAKSLNRQRRRSVIDLPASFHPHPSDATQGKNLPGRQPQGYTNALPEEYPSSELVDLYEKVQMCLDLRHKYMDLSLQRFEQTNPKNSDDWVVYPPPPKPTYKSKNKFNQLPGQHLDQEEIDMSKFPVPDRDASDRYELKHNDGDVYEVIDKETGEPITRVPTLREYYTDLNKIAKIS